MSPPLDIQSVNPANPTLPVGSGNGQLTYKQPTVLPSTATPRPHEIKSDSKIVELGFSVDHESNALKIKVTNQVSGEVVREFEIKGLNSAHHDPVNSKGVIVDDRT